MYKRQLLAEQGLGWMDVFVSWLLTERRLVWVSHCQKGVARKGAGVGESLLAEQGLGWMDVFVSRLSTERRLVWVSHC